MFKTIRVDAPEYIRSSFTCMSDIHAGLLCSSSNFQLYTPKPHLEYIEIHNSNSVHHFKARYLRCVNS